MFTVDAYIEFTADLLGLRVLPSVKCLKQSIRFCSPTMVFCLSVVACLLKVSCLSVHKYIHSSGGWASNIVSKKGTGRLDETAAAKRAKYPAGICFE